MKARLIVGRQGLNARRPRQPMRLVERQRVSNILRAPLREAGGKRCPILGGLSRTLRHEWQHRMASVAQECNSTDRPTLHRWAVEEGPDKRFVHRLQNALELGMPALVKGNCVCYVAAVSP